MLNTATNRICVRTVIWQNVTKCAVLPSSHALFKTIITWGLEMLHAKSIRCYLLAIVVTMATVGCDDGTANHDVFTKADGTLNLCGTFDDNVANPSTNEKSCCATGEFQSAHDMSEITCCEGYKLFHYQYRAGVPSCFYKSHYGCFESAPDNGNCWHVVDQLP